MTTAKPERPFTLQAEIWAAGDGVYVYVRDANGARLDSEKFSDNSMGWKCLGIWLQELAEFERRPENQPEAMPFDINGHPLPPLVGPDHLTMDAA